MAITAPGAADDAGARRRWIHQLYGLASVSTPEGTSLSYDYEGPLLRGAGSDLESVSWTYDNDLAMSAETVCTALGTQCTAVSFGYDADKLLTAAGAMTLSRDPASGRLETATLEDLSEFWGYNAFGETAVYESDFGAEVLFREEYTRDDGGRISSKQVTLAGATTTLAYGYDPAGRLTDVTRDGAPAAHYEYDENGNRLSRTTPSGTDSASCDAQDRMATYGGTTYQYAPAGELASATTGSSTTQYVYDELGNLLQVRLPDGRVVDYEIDGQNRRAGRKVDGTATHRWLYAGQLRNAAELDADGGILSRFVYATRSNVPDYLVKAGSTYRIITDHLGSPRLILNTATGTIAQQIEYDEFGNVLLDTNPGFQPFGFAGGLYDRDTGLVRFGTRDYDAHTGRWTAKDPLGFGGGDANVYAYVYSDPVNLIDPSGLDALTN